MSERKRWSDLPPWQRGGVSLAAVVQMALLGAALWDLRRRPDAEIRGSRKLWRLAVFVNYIGPIAYFWKGRRTAGS